MARYNALMNRATTNTTNGVGALYQNTSGMRRFAIYHFALGSPAAPADQVFEWEFNRSTAAPTGGTSVTPQALDPADAATGVLCMEGALTNGTLTSNAVVYSVPLNQRASFVWTAGTRGELIVPATASNGIHFLTTTASSTPSASINVHFEEY